MCHLKKCLLFLAKNSLNLFCFDHNLAFYLPPLTLDHLDLRKVIKIALHKIPIKNNFVLISLSKEKKTLLNKTSFSLGKQRTVFSDI